MRVAFCSVGGVNEPSYWSGTPYFMARHLRLLIPDLITIGPLQVFSSPFKLKQTLYTKSFGENYLCDLEPLLHCCLSAEVERKLEDAGGADVILSPGCFPYPNAFLDQKTPVVFWADATIDGLLQIFPNYSRLCSENVWCGQELQQRMIDLSKCSVFASQWAADSASDRYAADPTKIRTIPFGANLHFTIEDRATLELILAKRDFSECRLVLVARNWHERNCGFAVEVLRLLHAAGIKSRLTVVGCHEPATLSPEISPYVDLHPGLLKDAGVSERYYVKILAESHFLLHPSTNTCFGIGLCEANAWGVPVFAHDVAGISSVVTEGENGYKFALLAQPEDYAAKIIALFSDTDKYKRLCRASWTRFNTALNWGISTQAIYQVLEEAI